MYLLMLYCINVLQQCNYRITEMNPEVLLQCKNIHVHNKCIVFNYL